MVLILVGDGLQFFLTRNAVRCTSKEPFYTGFALSALTADWLSTDYLQEPLDGT